MTNKILTISSKAGNETRNIIDHYHYWKHEAILADLDTRANNFSVLCSNLYNDFNIATCIRNSNAFLAKKVVIYGSKQYDRRGTVGTHHYVRMLHAGTFPGLVQTLDSLRQEVGMPLHLVAVDNVPGARRIDSYEWPKEKHVVMMFGQEQVGLPSELLEIADDIVYIAQYGSVRSLNVGTASGVVMYDYCAKTL
jgi:tRNA G18 (ribose-2'-O)-methylase SpoU